MWGWGRVEDGASVLFFFGWGDWGLNLRLCACKAGTVLLEPHF
jgi:hypothetical protein